MSSYQEPVLRFSAAILLAAIVQGCVKDQPAVLEPAGQEASLAVSGRILGPDGRNICLTIGEGTLLVRLINPEFGFTSDVPFLAQQDVTCPDNSYSVPDAPEGGPLRVEVPTNENIDALPWRTLKQLDGSDPTQNVRIRQGTPLGGGARLDGEPFGGVFMGLAYEFNPNFAVTNVETGPDGRWGEFFDRLPAVLQNGQRYVVTNSTCDLTLGTRQLAGPAPEGFLFPSERSALNCDLETAASAQFSHSFNRLAVTPMPGDIGGWFGSVLSDQYGVGYGVQFLVDPDEPPLHGPTEFSEIFQGGLMVGIAPDQILTGVDVGGFLPCDPASCHDLGLDGTVEFAPIGSSGRKAVTWRYTDNSSPERAGLRIIQRSIDGPRGRDYVLFRFVFRNTSRSDLTFFAGFVGDWDIDLDPVDDVGFTAMERRLMFQTSTFGTGLHVGTMLLGDVPATGNYYIDLPGEVLSEADQLRALRGAIRRASAGPGDLRNIHGAGPIQLKPQQTRDLWLAIVAGQDKAELMANARAASADVASRLTEPIADAATSVFNPGPPVRGTGRASAGLGKRTPEQWSPGKP